MGIKVARRVMLAAMLAAGICSSAAQSAIFEQAAGGWRLQDYNDGNITVWYTSSSCTTGKLVLLGSSASSEVKNRFWSAVMTAKASGRIIGIDYSTATGDCVIQSFWF